jgi:HEAT repeat protein
MGESVERRDLDVGLILTAAGQKQRKVFVVFAELLTDADRDIRLAAAESLGRIGDQRAASVLMTALSDKDNAVRRAAVKSLEDLNFQGAK